MSVLIEHRCMACGTVSTQAQGSNPICWHPGKSKGLKPRVMHGSENYDTRNGRAQVAVKRAKP